MKSDDEWESEVVVVEVNGVLDAQTVRQAIAAKQTALRRADTDAPLLQVVAASDKTLRTEKALLTAATAPAAMQTSGDSPPGKDRPPQRQNKK
ncbi:hypothetical protein Q1695_008980 [Nippostrongylus brasiliensis]|nr:hypothetical protein Q1695_008980 [Nippostrongylus brasiliensis]